MRLLPLALLLTLAGCGNNIERSFGLTRDPPDEFTVTTRAPLSMPPEFTLTPPAPGAPRPQELSAQQQAEAALAPDTAIAAPKGADSAGQDALVQQAGPAAPANIRSQVDAEAAKERPNQSLTDRLLFWQSSPPPGSVIDPNAEAARIRANQALGNPVTAGNTIIQPHKQSGWLGNGFLGIF